MKNIENILENIGFSRKKSQVYLAILELGTASVIEIAKKSNLKRTTVYNILPELMTEGLVKKGINKGKRYFFIDDPSDVKTNFEEKVQKIDMIIPRLKQIQTIIPYKPKITFYEGPEGMKKWYRDILDSLYPGDTIYTYMGLDDFYNFVPVEFSEFWMKKRAAKKIRAKLITADSQVARKWKVEAIKNLQEIKIVNNQGIEFKSDMKIYGNKVAFISYKENFMGLVIESTEISRMQRTAFELLWNLL